MSYKQVFFSGVLLLLALSLIYLLKIIFNKEKNLNKRNFKIRISFLLLLSVIFLSSNDWLQYFNDEATKYNITITLEIFWWVAAMYLINQFIEYFIWNKTFESSGIFIPKIIRDFIKLFVFISVVICIKHFVFKGDLLGIFTFSGLFALLLGYSAQTILGDVFAGISMNLVRQFEPGQWIKIFGLFGVDMLCKVVQINSRFAQLLTLQDNYLTIPNSVMSKLAILNLSTPKERHLVHIELPINDASPPYKIKSLIKSAALEVKSILRSPEPNVCLIKMKQGEFLYSLDCYTQQPDQNILFDELLSNIWYKLKRANIPLHAQILSDFETIKPVDLVAHLKKLDLFSMLRVEEIKQLAHESKILFFGPPERILEQDAANDSLYILFKGGVDIFLKMDDSKLKKIASLNAGDYFGEMSLLTGVPCQASVYANSESLIIEINHQTMRDLFQKRPELMEKMSEVMMKRKMITDEFQEFNKLTKEKQQKMVSGLLTRIQLFFL